MHALTSFESLHDWRERTVVYTHLKFLDGILTMKSVHMKVYNTCSLYEILGHSNPTQKLLLCPMLTSFMWMVASSRRIILPFGWVGLGVLSLLKFDGRQEF